MGFWCRMSKLINMNVGKYIFGIDKLYLNGYEKKIIRRQVIVYNALSLMLLTLTVLVFIAGYTYGLVIFGHWLYALLAGIVFSFISFIILLLVLFLNMTTKHKSLYDMMTNMESVFKKYYGKDLTLITDAEAHKIVEENKQKISVSSIEPDDDTFHWSKIVTSTIKVVLILIISVVTANGIELLMFRNNINESFAIIKSSEELYKPILQKKNLNSQIQYPFKVNNAEWTLSMLEEDPGKPFQIINSYSILLAIDVMNMSLSKWKILIDVLFSLLFLTPFILVKKSKEYSGGEYQKEVAIHVINTSLMFFLLSQRECQQIKQTIYEDFDYESALKVNYRI